MGIYERLVNGYSLLWEPVVDGDFFLQVPLLKTFLSKAGGIFLF